MLLRTSSKGFLLLLTVRSSNCKTYIVVGKDEVEKLYSKWKSQSPDGELDRETFGNGLKGIGVTDPLIIEQYFTAFDNNKVSLQVRVELTSLGR